MPVSVSLLDASDTRFPPCPDSNLVSVFHSGMSERTRVAGAPDGWCRVEIPAARQLLPLDQGLGQGAALDEPPGRSQLANYERDTLSPGAIRWRLNAGLLVPLNCNQGKAARCGGGLLLFTRAEHSTPQRVSRHARTSALRKLATLGVTPIPQ